MKHKRCCRTALFPFGRSRRSGALFEVAAALPCRSLGQAEFVMSRYARHAMLSLSIVSLSAQVGAQPQQPSPPRIVWSLEWQEPYCTVSISAPIATFSLWNVPGSISPELYLIGEPSRLSQIARDTARISLSPNDETFEVRAQSQTSNSKQRIWKLIGLTQDFIGAFAKSTLLTVAAGDETVSIPLKGASKAAAALESCVEMKLPEWGIDPKAFAALRTKPEALKGYSFLTHRDYPDDALRAMKSGRVVTRLSVDAKGKVTDCAVIVSSGTESMNRVTCAKALQRGKYKPAIGADGQPTAASVVISTEFTVSG